MFVGVLDLFSDLLVSDDTEPSFSMSVSCSTTQDALFF